MPLIALELQDVTMCFGGLNALDKINFYIPEKTVFGLIGPNGAGKTTLFNVITGVNTLTKGKIKLFGKNIQGKPIHQISRLGIARTFQNIRLFNECSVYENLLIAAEQSDQQSTFQKIFYGLIGESKKNHAILNRCNACIDIFEFTKKKNKKAKYLPYGDQKKLEIARALATGASLLLLDEPAAGLNPAETDELKHFIHVICASFNVTILLIEHDMKLMMSVAQQIVVLDHGRKIAQGSPKEIQKNAAVIEAYLGFS